ncbi:cytochrome P450 [Aspergillus navahoensis]
MYPFNGVEVIRKKFNESNSRTFEVLAPDNRYAVVSSGQHLKELDAAPDMVLPFQAASKQILQPRYTMQGSNWFDWRGTEGVGFVRALRTPLTNNIPLILPNLNVMIKSLLCEMDSQQPVRVVVLANAVSFFGEELGVHASALRYIEETVICAEILRLMPAFLHSIYKTLLPIAEQRCLERNLKNLGHEVPKHKASAELSVPWADCIQWIMETSPRKAPWSGKRVVHELMATWFGSTITFAIHDLCLHPEYTEPLRAELEAKDTQFLQSGRGLPLMDSFFKESARLTPVESTSLSRAIPAPFKIPQRKPTLLCDANASWHVLGFGRMVCPGRYYAAAIIKLVMAQIILNYDCRLVDPGVPRWFTWRSTILPSPKTKVVFSPRSNGSMR